MLLSMPLRCSENDCNSYLLATSMASSGGTAVNRALTLNDVITSSSDTVRGKIFYKVFLIFDVVACFVCKRGQDVG